ncbi:acyltransferase family protein [Actibacterium lipolyticum]|uniref:O-acetyltransferase OatA n=1 Tax=Actibacterium lipolyticum TaxID=1524263 RepID=A0A238KWU5_9RHOB|nr:acyltransferase family protein [Actibacterium lipolyticum]SMX47285.1 O-acetyltransferase OatA [Actibacterium lipolyticum]
MRAYRPDIDGLRAIAVLVVVFYHYGVPGFSGGYVGVDVFFVISGYLITSLISDEMRAGRFSFRNFYERRIRRIFPALFPVIAFSLIASWSVFALDDYRNLGQSAVAVSVFSSNILFWLEDGYFGPASHLKPLLHTWSLAVEEQFYFVVPLLLLALRRAGWVMLGLSLASLVAAQWMLTRDAAAAFYLMPFRFWELGVGCWIALVALPAPRNGIYRAVLAGMGLLAILSASVFYTPNTVFPGLTALLPCLGTGAIIVAGNGAQSAVRRVLSTRPMVGIGKISYSFYLWHWPVFVIAQYWLVDALSPLQVAVIFALSLLLSALSWRYVEQPFRARTGDGWRIAPMRVFSSAIAASALTIGFGVAAHLTAGFPARLPDNATKFQKIARFEPSRTCPETLKSDSSTDLICRFGTAANPTVLIWGDSHAIAVLPEFIRQAERSETSAIMMARPGCPPVADIERISSGYYDCPTFNARVADRAAGQGITKVVIIARWSAYFDGIGYGPLEAFGHAGDVNLVSTASDKLPPAQALETHLRKTVAKLMADGKQVFLIYPVPEFAHDIPRVAMRGGAVAAEHLSTPRQEHLSRSESARSALSSIVEKTGAIGLIPDRLLCDDALCHASRDGVLLYKDNDHLSENGAKLISPILGKVFDGGL